MMIEREYRFFCIATKTKNQKRRSMR